MGLGPEWLQRLASVPRACQTLLLFACTNRSPSWLQANITVGNCVLMLEQADHYKMQKLGEVGSFGFTAPPFELQCVTAPSPSCQAFGILGSPLVARLFTDACDVLPLRHCQVPCNAVQAWQANWACPPCVCTKG